MTCLDAAWMWPSVAALLVVAVIILLPIFLAYAVFWRFTMQVGRLRRKDCTDSWIIGALFVGVLLTLLLPAVAAFTGSAAPLLATVKCPGAAATSAGPEPAP